MADGYLALIIAFEPGEHVNERNLCLQIYFCSVALDCDR